MMQSSGNVPTSTRTLTADDLAAVLALQRDVTAGLEKGYLHAKTDAEVLDFLTGTKGVAYGIFDDAALLAAALLAVPSEGRPNAALAFGKVPVEDWPLRTCFVESTMVARSARGRGYQKKLLDFRIARAAQLGMRWICAGVQMGNWYSWRNLLTNGFTIADMRSDRGYTTLGLLRGANGALPIEAGCAPRFVDAMDKDGHRRALDDGYVGTDLRSDGVVIYRRWAATGSIVQP